MSCQPEGVKRKHCNRTWRNDPPEYGSMSWLNRYIPSCTENAIIPFNHLVDAPASGVRAPWEKEVNGDESSRLCLKVSARFSEESHTLAAAKSS